jgi:hypothetical protein
MELSDVVQYLNIMTFKSHSNGYKYNSSHNYIPQHFHSAHSNNDILCSYYIKSDHILKNKSYRIMKQFNITIVTLCFMNWVRSDPVVDYDPGNGNDQDSLSTEDVQFWTRFFSNDATSLSSEMAIVVPSIQPSIVPSSQPSEIPSTVPSTVPTGNPTMLPSTIPTHEPSVTPTILPSQMPIGIPSVVPTFEPSSTPTNVPSVVPTIEPSSTPTNVPSVIPTVDPSEQPTTMPSDVPTAEPSATPTTVPSDVPTVGPSVMPTTVPSDVPTIEPSVAPTALPSDVPTIEPSVAPTALPSDIPLAAPSISPTAQPSILPTVVKSEAPSLVPSGTPTVLPSATPNTVPSNIPTIQPSNKPSHFPSTFPSSGPTLKPTGAPTVLPIKPPLAQSTIVPTKIDSTTVSNPDDTKCRNVQVDITCDQVDNGDSCDLIPFRSGRCSSTVQALTFQYNPLSCNVQSASCKDFGRLSDGLSGSIRCTDGSTTDLLVRPTVVSPGRVFSVTNFGDDLPSTIECLITNGPENDAQIISINATDEGLKLDVVGSLKLIACLDESCFREIHHQIKVSNVGNTAVEVTNVTVSSTLDNTNALELVPANPIVTQNYVIFDKSSRIDVCTAETYTIDVNVSVSNRLPGSVGCVARDKSIIKVSQDPVSAMPSTVPSEWPSVVPSSIPTSVDANVKTPKKSGKDGKSVKGGKSGKKSKSGKGGKGGMAGKDKKGGNAEMPPTSSIVQAPYNSLSGKGSFASPASASDNAKPYSGKGIPTSPSSAIVNGAPRSGKGYAPSSAAVHGAPRSGKGFVPSSAAVNGAPRSGEGYVPSSASVSDPTPSSRTSDNSKSFNGKGYASPPTSGIVLLASKFHQRQRLGVDEAA